HRCHEHRDHREGEGTIAEELDRYDRVARARLDPNEERGDGETSGDEATNGEVSPVPRLLVRQADEDRNECRDEDGGAEVVDTRTRVARAHPRQRSPDDREDDG